MKRMLCLLFASMLVLVSCSQGASPPASGSTGASTAAPASSTASAATPVNEADSGVAKDGLPIVQETIQMRALVAKYIDVPDWNGHPYTEQMKEWTNIDIAWDCVPDAGFEEKRNLVFASNDLPDFVMRAKLSPQLEAKYAQAGQLLTLNDYMDYLPNLSRIMEEDEGIRKGIAQPDGNIYAFPQLNTTEGNLVSKQYINKTWLDRLGLDMPTTTEEFYQTLLAFRDQDANGNGNPNDEIPYAGTHKPGGNDRSYRMVQNLLGAWGIGHYYPIKDEPYAYVDVDANNTVYLTANDNRFRGVVEYLAKLWAEGLIDKESFSQDRNAVAPKITEDLVGYVFDGNNTQWMGASRENFVAMPALTGPNGDRKWIDVSSNVQGTGACVVTTACQYPEAAMRWIDFGYSEQGTVAIRMGIEGESWYKDDDGKYQLFDHIKNDPNGLTLDQAVSQWSVYCGGSVPQFITDDVDQSAAQLPQTKADTEVLNPDRVQFSQVPKLKFTEEESNRLSRYEQDIVPYINENLVKFITGERPMSEWDAYTTELGKMDIEAYLSIYQASFDRWNS
ncbi:extracellular solute-binding protein [Ruminococcaceae bacterium OttesenSCG-928-L11]|nr:extracellular solute-binding protein [Ruminococcaceae bacterium OttesenSCG-928-L11]